MDPVIYFIGSTITLSKLTGSTLGPFTVGHCLEISLNFQTPCIDQPLYMLEPNMPQSKVPSEYLFLWGSEFLVILVSDIDSTFQCLDHLLSLFRDNSSMSWKIFLWVIIDVKPLSRLGLLPTWLFLLQIKLHITIMLTMTLIYEGNLVSFWCANALWGNYAQILW